MNRSRRLMLRMTAVGVATSGLASLHWAAAATPTTIGTRTQELLKLHKSVRSRVATRTATLAFANELRASRDDAIKRMVGPIYAPKLIEIPVSTRTRVADFVFDLVGDAASPAPNPSGAQIDILAHRLNAVMMVTAIIVNGTAVRTGSPSTDINHPCHGAEITMLAAADLLKWGWEQYRACDEANFPKPPDTEPKIGLFETSEGSEDPSPTNEQENPCQDEYEYLERRIDVWNRAVDQFNACMLANG